MGFEKSFEKVFDAGHIFLVNISERWKRHSNRRTTLVLILVGALCIGVYWYAIRPPDNFPVNSLVSVSEGSSLREVAYELERTGVVRNAMAFRILVGLTGRERNVRAGDYLFKEPQDVFVIARALELGAFGLEPFRIRIPEGAMVRDMAVIFSRQLERFNAERFLEQAKPQEGYLFPDTYFFMPNATEATIIQAMRQNFDKHMATISPQIASSTHTLDEIVIMASIIEREARDHDDRRMISGVLWNRIAKRMPLQVDVTFLYTIGKGTFQLTMKDLVTDSPYNTYMNKGLPPSAIGSPSLDSILAAAVPTKNDYLFYLADNRGVTHFSKTYQEHLKKKRLYLGT